MTRDEMVREIRLRLKEDSDLDVSKEIIQEVIKQEEQLVYEAIAVNDSVNYIYGKIYGKEKEPKKVTGLYADYLSVRNNYGYSTYKTGYPDIKWTNESKECEEHSPKWYFELPEVKYTSKARKFRQDAGLPEIPEFSGMDNEQIEAICKKADQKELNKLSKDQLRIKTRLDRKKERQKKMLHEKWKEQGYVPTGCDGYNGFQRDAVNTFVVMFMSDTDRFKSLRDELDNFRYVIDLAELKKLNDIHPEIYEIEKIYQEKLRMDGIPEIEHQQLGTHLSIGKRTKYLTDYPYKDDTKEQQIKRTSIEYNIENFSRDFVQELCDRLGVDRSVIDNSNNHNSNNHNSNDYNSSNYYNSNNDNNSNNDLSQE